MTDCIRLYPELMAPSLCQELIDGFERDPRKRAGHAFGHPQAKRSTDLGIRGLPEWIDLCARVDAAVLASLRRYREDVPNFRDIHRHVRDTGYLIQAYRPNGEDGFDWHADAVNRASCDRVLAMIAYLNDVEVGGETEFRAQERMVKPRRGTILWFPAGFEYVHRGRPPLSGPKYIVTSFLAVP